jgi:hypothetical protein
MNKKESAMNTYVLSFRGHAGATSDAQTEAAWVAWFGELGGAIVDFGNRVGQTEVVGRRNRGDRTHSLAGYIVINAEGIDEAVALAKGCPLLADGGRVEVGQTIPMT